MEKNCSNCGNNDGIVTFIWTVMSTPAELVAVCPSDSDKQTLRFGLRPLLQKHTAVATVTSSSRSYSVARQTKGHSGKGIHGVAAPFMLKLIKLSREVTDLNNLDTRTL